MDDNEFTLEKFEEAVRMLGEPILNDEAILILPEWVTVEMVKRGHDVLMEEAIRRGFSRFRVARPSPVDVMFRCWTCKDTGIVGRSVSLDGYCPDCGPVQAVKGDG